jgi:drug/metabolite transporter (DMT)-like permease
LSDTAPSDFARDRRQRLIGIALMCGAVAAFALLDATAKYLNHHMDTMQVVWARYTAAFVLALVWLNPWSRPGMLTTTRPLLQIGRSTLLLGSTVFNFLAFKYLRLDQALAIMFSTPFFVAVLSGPILGEWVGWRRWTAIGVGFAGVMVVTRPGAGGIHPAALLSVASALCYAAYAITTRLLARTDSTETTLFYSNLVGVLALMPVLPFVWTTPDNWFLVALMVLVGAMGSFGHYMLIVGHRLAPPAVLAPFIYTQLAWATILGYLIFADVPDRWTLFGAAIVVASGLYMLNRERMVGPRTDPKTEKAEKRPPQV